MARFALGPGIGVVTRGPVGSSGKKAVSDVEEEEEESNAEAAAEAPERRETVADARGRREMRAAGGVSRLLSERSPREVRRRVAMMANEGGSAKGEGCRCRSRWKRCGVDREVASSYMSNNCV
jgi:hypothetical protein